jgi:chromosome segregation ATPase
VNTPQCYGGIQTTIEDEVLSDLRNHLPWTEILKKYRGKSSIYSALTKFFDETDKTLDERYVEIKKSGNELAEKKSEKNNLKHEIEKYTTEQKNSLARCQKLSKKARKKERAIAQLEARATKLQQKGYTPQIMKKLQEIDAKSPHELLQRVDTVQKHAKLKEENSKLEANVNLLNKKAARALAKKQQAEQAAISKRNELDELSLKLSTLEDAVKIATSFLEDGFTVEDMQSMKEGLRIVGVAGNPQLTIKRFVTALRKLKTLTLIEKMIAEKQNELNNLEKAITKSKTKLVVAEETTLKSINKTQKTAEKAVNKISIQTEKRIKNTADAFDAKLAQSIANADERMKQIAENLKKGLDEWSKLEEKVAYTKEYILPGQALLGMLSSPEYLKSVALSIIARLLERLQLLFELKLKEATAKPSEEIYRKDIGLQPYHNYKLPVLMEFLSESLRRIVNTLEKNNHDKVG